MNEYYHNNLRFGVNENKPTLESTSIQDTIYAKTEKEFIGHNFVFNIIGSSHYIYCESIPYYEISSCKPVEATSVYSINIDTDIDLQFTFESDSVKTKTTVKSYKLDRFVKDKDYDLKYKFSEDAYTAIELKEESYITWHTYPVFNLALYTETDFYNYR